MPMHGKKKKGMAMGGAGMKKKKGMARGGAMKKARGGAARRRQSFKCLIYKATSRILNAG